MLVADVWTQHVIKLIWQRRRIVAAQWWFSRICQIAYPKQHLDWFIRFLTAHGKRSLYFTIGRPFPPQNCHFAWGYGPPSNVWFLWPTRVHNPNGISIGSAVFTGLTIVTDHATPSVKIHHIIYLCSTAMWPNNIIQLQSSVKYSIWSLRK